MRGVYEIPHQRQLAFPGIDTFLKYGQEFFF